MFAAYATAMARPAGFQLLLADNPSSLFRDNRPGMIAARIRDHAAARGAMIGFSLEELRLWSPRQKFRSALRRQRRTGWLGYDGYRTKARGSGCGRA